LLDFTEDVASIYKKLDVFVLPSVLPDPFPTVVLEAMSMGLPIVAYHHGGVVEMLGEEGAFAAPGDVEGLAEAIMKVGLDEARLRIAGDLSRLRFDEFSSRRFKNAFLGCYSEVAAGSD
jgi:glycosyltransferase involved in cell wall biosynthesis